MKLSVSLSEADIEFMDEYSSGHGAASRSAVLQRALQVLRAAELGQSYADAWQEFADAGEAEVWDNIVADGLH